MAKNMCVMWGSIITGCLLFWGFVVFLVCGCGASLLPVKQTPTDPIPSLSMFYGPLLLHYEDEREMIQVYYASSDHSFVFARFVENGGEFIFYFNEIVVLNFVTRAFIGGLPISILYEDGQQEVGHGGKNIACISRPGMFRLFVSCTNEILADITEQKWDDYLKGNEWRSSRKR